MPDPSWGQVWWAELPDPHGRRPVLILTRTEAINRLLGVTIAPLTRTIRGVPTEVPVGPDDGLATRCVVSLDNVTTIDRDRLDEFVAELPIERMNEVCEALHAALDLPF